MMDSRRCVRFTFALLLSVLLLASCKSARMAVQDKSGARPDGEEQLEAVIANTPAFDSFSSNLRLTVPLNSGEYTLNGTFKMQRDGLIRISLLLPVIRTEVVRIELSPEKILLIDRMNKRYVSAPVSELREALHTEVDFPMLQALFSNTLFLPGKYTLSRSDYASFQVQGGENNGVQLSRKSREFVYSFLTSPETHRLVGSSIQPHSSSYGLQWQYDRFVPVGETTFPSEMTVLIGKKDDPIRATLELSRLSTDEQILSPTDIPARYEQIGLNDFLKMLENL